MKHILTADLHRSLTFRTHASQESLFSELRNLKLLVEESLKAAAPPHDGDADETDPLAAQQSRNLQSLAAAAEKFHSAASSTASTRYSSHWGSETGGPRLTLAQRERIELWNDRYTVAESVTLEGSPTRPAMTSPIEYPNMGATRLTPELGKETGLGASLGNLALDNDDDDDDDDESSGSDVESDLLRNFEAFAYASFQGQNYSKAEQLLRMAVEQSTGDKSGTVDFKSLKLKLALCCCLQEKWDHAAGIVASLPKTRTPPNLPIFHLLQAMSLAHLAGNRCDDAYAVCKSALNGKKKILGRTSVDYYGCLAVFAAICEKRGNALEAEAVRHSIPEGWSPRSGASIVLSPTQYILQHETLIQAVFSPGGATPSDPGPSPTHRRDNPSVSEATWTTTASTASGPWSTASGHTASEPWSSTSGHTASGHWSTLLPPAQRDGVEAAQRDEGSGTVVEETDTGKELLAGDHPSAPASPAPPRHAPPPIPTSSPTRSWHSGDDLQSPRSPEASQSPLPTPIIQIHSAPFIEQLGGAGQGDDYVSTLEPMPNQDQDKDQDTASQHPPLFASQAPRPVSAPPRYTPSPGPSRTRWIVPRDISNVGERRPVGKLGPPEVLFLRPRGGGARPNARSVGVAVMPEAPDVVAVGIGGRQPDIFEIATDKSVSSVGNSGGGVRREDYPRPPPSSLPPLHSWAQANGHVMLSAVSTGV